TVSSEVPKFIHEGENTINITDTNGFFDTYCFVSAEGGRFSLTVPEGVSVQMNKVDLIKDNNELHAANFTVPAGVRVEFSFKVVSEVNGSTTTTVTIGEPVEETLPTVTTDGTTELSLPAKSGTSGNFIGAVGVAQVGAIEAGKYTLTIKLNGTLRGCSVAFAKVQDVTTCNEASFYNFFDNAGNVRTDEESLVEAYINTGNYNTTTVNGADYIVASTITKATWTITLDLAEGDFLVFANGGTTEAPITLSLTKVAE
ncbi:MAG: hypothetical protein K2O67_00340, partial [Clostridia bacterium]|nr:hypothetical protein [Clostridia bacterium]